MTKMIATAIKPKPAEAAACTDPFTHEFTTIGAKRMAHPELGEKVVTTLVLKWCGRCKNHIVIPFSGDWSLDDFLRKESEVDELNRMAGKDSGK
jgi:hypothetical protein